MNKNINIFGTASCTKQTYNKIKLCAAMLNRKCYTVVGEAVDLLILKHKLKLPATHEDYSNTSDEI